jgi:hypothetical protein
LFYSFLDVTADAPQDNLEHNKTHPKGESDMTDSQGNIQVEEKLPSAIPTEDKPAEATEPKLPDGVAERTAAEFEKLKQHNAELKDQLDAYKSKTSVLDELKPAEVQVETPNLPPSKVEEIKSKFVDENGFVDVAAVESALIRAEERAKKAEEKANSIEKRIQNSEETQQVKVAHTEFPQLDPHGNKFDAKFYNLVKNELIGQMMNGEQDIVKAAHKVSEYYTPANVEQVKSEAVNEYKEKVTKRSQATENVVSRGKGEPSDQEELIRKTRAGDPDALFKRLQASGN